MSRFRLSTAMLAASLALALGAAMPALAEPQGKPAVAAKKKGATVKLEDKYATNNGVKIHYVASGPANGPLVVMIHGFPDFWMTWDQLIPALNDKYRVVAMDTRGYNLSDKPEKQEDYAMANLVGDVAAVIKAEGRPKATVIGHDWGAAIAWQVAFNVPQMVDKLVILSVPHPAAFSRELATNPKQMANSQYARNFQKEGSEKNLNAEGLAGWVKDPATKAKYVEAFKRSSFLGMMSYYRMNYPDPAKQATAPPPPKLEVPLLVIHGMDDTALLASGHSGTWDYVGKDTSMLMVPGAGHFVQHDAAELVDKTIRNWLDVRQ